MAIGRENRRSMLSASRRKRCWKYDWVLEFDIKGLFDNIDHEVLAAGRPEARDVQMGAASSDG